MNQTDILKPYTCHKRVRAAEIAYIGNYDFHTDGGVVRQVMLVGDHSVDLSQEMFTRYIPVPGDFYLLYEDGYQSFSPRKAFIDGYAIENGENVLMERLNDLSMAGPGVAPTWLQSDGWVRQVARVAREAYVTINSLKFQLEQQRATLRDCVHGTEVVDIGGGEMLGLHLPNKNVIWPSERKKNGETNTDQA